MINRMDHAGLTVQDIDAATEFFVVLGMEPLGDGAVGGRWVDRIVGLDGVDAQIAMLGTPDGHSRVELVQFRAPAGPPARTDELVNVPGLRHLCFNVDDIAATLERLQPLGAELIGDIVRYEDSYLLCYLRGPDGIIVELAEDIG